MSRWSSLLSSWGRQVFAIVAAGVLSALLLGVLTAAFHHDAGTGCDPHCVVCALAAAPATAAPPAPALPLPQTHLARLTHVKCAQPACADPRSSAARAPPHA